MVVADGALPAGLVSAPQAEAGGALLGEMLPVIMPRYRLKIHPSHRAVRSLVLNPQVGQWHLSINNSETEIGCRGISDLVRFLFRATLSSCRPTIQLALQFVIENHSTDAASSAFNCGL